MGNKPAHFEIVFEPMPIKVSTPRPGKRDWHKKLRPLRSSPGASARILRCASRSQADYYVRTIRRKLEEADPEEKWDFESHPLQDIQGGFGVWGIYRGKYSAQELRDKELKRAEWSKKMRLAYEKRELRKVKAQYQDGVIRPSPIGRE